LKTEAKVASHINPCLLQLCGDEEGVSDFIESLNPKELSIMKRHNNPRIIKRLYLRVRNDIDQTAKDLAIED